jgi:hypothetical protein
MVKQSRGRTRRRVRRRTSAHRWSGRRPPITELEDQQSGKRPPHDSRKAAGGSGPRGHVCRQSIGLASSLESLGRFGSVIWASVWTCDQLEYGKVGVFHPIL